jgi:hypothetical protein
VLAPLLFAAWFVLNLAADNGAELIRLSDLALPAAVSLCVASLAMFMARRAVHSSNKAALWATGVVVVFSTFGVLVQAAERRGFQRLDGFLAFLLLGLVYVGLRLRRSSRSFSTISHYLTVVGGVLVGLAVLRLALQYVRPTQTLRAADTLAATSPSAQRQPDIYLILLDKYTGSRLLQSNYGYDNTPFEEALRKRGFIVPRNPRANYVNTFLALAAMLNYRYMDELPDRFGEDNPNRSVAYPLVEDSRLVRQLKAAGYRFVFFPTAFGPTRRNRLADLNLPDPEQIQPEFFSAWRRTTAIPVLHEWTCAVLGCRIDRMPLIPESAALLDWKLEQLAGLPDDGRPVFAFLHLAAPHEPYVYNADCRYRTPFWPPEDGGVWETAVREAYVAAIKCVNTKLLAVVDSLRVRSSVPPIILLQSDHGHGRLGRNVPDFAGIPPDRVAERLSVFAAYALPGVPDAEVWDTITPVNVSRLVLRHYFAAELPPLEDRSIWSPLEYPFRYTEIRR